MSDTTKEVLRAVGFALYKHSNQRRSARSSAFVPYMVHPVEVSHILTMIGVADVVTLQVAILHDVLEDTDCTEETLAMCFGQEVTDLVKVLTLKEKLPGEEKCRRQVEAMHKADRRARMVKIADKASNLRDMVRCPPGWSRKAYVGYTEGAYKVVKAADHGDIPQALLIIFGEAYKEIQEWIQEQTTDNTVKEQIQ